MYEQIEANQRNSLLILAGFVLFIFLLAWVFTEVLAGGFGIFGFVFAGGIA
ncbi:MAG: zinc metalloprotease HtpX, partial [Candidatus Diapherotrites archaeon]|nr:zinc metalloprotease HtpX [Candidatus Diapherotrites archaeon]